MKGIKEVNERLLIIDAKLDAIMGHMDTVPIPRKECERLQGGARDAVRDKMGLFVGMKKP